MYNTGILKQLYNNGDLFWGDDCRGGWFAMYDSGVIVVEATNCESKNAALDTLVNMLMDELFHKCEGMP